VECGLKACIAKMTRRYDFPNRNVKDIYTHDLTLLLRTAQLELARDEEAGGDGKFKYNWMMVKDWNEQSRYELASEQRAAEMFNAIADRRHGVLRWIKRHW